MPPRIIGGAVNKLPIVLLERYPEVPCQAVVALRNRVIHGYFGIDWNLIWQAVTEHVPGLRETIARILWDEFGAMSPEA